MNMNNFLQINETTRKRLSDFLFILWAGGAALLSYSLVYALRKPFTAASFENAEFFDMDYKVVVTISQILGYVISKFIGIKLISELKPEERFKFILTSVLLAEASLVLFGLLSTPFNVAAMFLNGLSLGCMWGVIFSFIEGRRVTDILASLLGGQYGYQFGNGQIYRIVCHESFSGERILDAGTDRYGGASSSVVARLGIKQAAGAKQRRYSDEV